MCTNTGLFENLEEEGYRTPDEMLIFLAVFIVRHTEHEKTALMTQFYTRYSNILADARKRHLELGMERERGRQPGMNGETVQMNVGRDVRQAL